MQRWCAWHKFQVKKLLVCQSSYALSSVCSVWQVPDLVVLRSAAHKAATAAHRGRLRTRSLHSECVVNVSGSKHVRCGPRTNCTCSAGFETKSGWPMAECCAVQIKESLVRFGVSPECKHLLVARFDSTPADVRGLALARFCALTAGYGHNPAVHR